MNERLIVICVSDTPRFASVFSVLIVFFCNLRRRIFFCWSESWLSLLVAATEVTALLRELSIVIVVEFVTAVTLLNSIAPHQLGIQRYLQLSTQQ